MEIMRGEAMKFYGTGICPDCVEANKLLSEKQIDCDYVDITESTANLKEFLKLRDHRSEFAEIKEEGHIGIPCFLKEDGSITFDPQGLL